MDTKKAADDAIKASDAEGVRLARGMTNVAVRFGVVTVLFGTVHAVYDWRADHDWSSPLLLVCVVVTSWLSGMATGVRKTMLEADAGLRKAFEDHEKERGTTP